MRRQQALEDSGQVFSESGPCREESWKPFRKRTLFTHNPTNRDRRKECTKKFNFANTNEGSVDERGREGGGKIVVLTPEGDIFWGTSH